MYNNPYFNPQASIDRINTQIAELEKMKSQIPQAPTPQQPSINQTFQLAPANNSVLKYVNSIDDVNKEVVYGDTPFFSKDLSVLWIKNSKGEIKAYELNEIVQKDEKDLLIEGLQFQVAQLRKEIEENAKSTNDNADKSVESEKSTTISDVGKSKTKSK